MKHLQPRQKNCNWLGWLLVWVCESYLPGPQSSVFLDMECLKVRHAGDSLRTIKALKNNFLKEMFGDKIYRKRLGAETNKSPIKQRKKKEAAEI